jgi:hypothetical protein
MDFDLGSMILTLGSLSHGPCRVDEGALVPDFVEEGDTAFRIAQQLPETSGIPVLEASECIIRLRLAANCAPH